ncbi:MAG TPA: C40 family peptidase [Bacteroidales bacterium]|nr:C40 family peptidase [Bacteroidales bacterium]HPB25356.1 C40 family peptidase [Bacteroidales bacterium]HPI30117.1 C40 family peptidase [Bacteroidales bacterium]HQN16151.1 C40 family peptidase [Bacteroidales bacterium]HQP15704.1 C40 family peptidase [Bacteroidales bacterium]
MHQGICVLSVVPVRAEPSDTSEIVSQLLFGELFRLTETRRSWVKICMTYDNYEGWIDKKQCCLLTDEEFQRLHNDVKAVATDTISIIRDVTLGLDYPIVSGSSLPGLDEKKLYIAGHEYFFDAVYRDVSVKADRGFASDLAFTYLNAPYLWGGRSPLGIDCSGFTQVVMKMCGIALPRDAAQQAMEGVPVDFVEQALPGDLAFFENAENRIIHTGIILSGQRIIHASGKVRLDDIDHEGIFNRDLGAYSHKLRCIRRVF